MAEKRRVFVAVYPAEAAAKAGQYIAGEAGDEFEVIGMADLLDDLPEKLEEGKPDLVLLYRGLPGVTDFREMVWRLRKERPLMRIIVLEGSVSEDDPATREFRADMVAAHVHDWVTGSLPGCLLDLMRKGRTFEEVAEYARARPGFAMEIGGTVRAGATNEGSVRTVEVQVERVISRRRPSHLLIASYSPAGGVGKSTATAYLGAWIAASGLPVCLLELDEDKPGLCRWFGVQPPQRGLDDLPEELFDDGDPLREAVRKITVRAGRNLSIVPTTGRAAGIRMRTKQHVYALLDVLLAEHAVVIADCSVKFKEAGVYYAIRRADHTLLLGNQNRVVADALVRHLATSEEVGMPRSRYQLVVNGYLEKVGMSVREIEDLTSLRAAQVVPMEPVAYQAALNRGRVSVDDDSPWAKLGRQLTVEMEEESEAVRRPARVAAGGGLLARIFRRR